MATYPYFVLGPNTVVSMLGLLRGSDHTPATPVDDWRQATVDVIIPAFNEEATIVLCLASVLRQTLAPRRIVLIDDGSTDQTVACAKAFCAHHGVNLTVIQRRKPIGKTPTIKRQARELDSDVEFILDGDTVLESENYIERLVQELHKGVGIASACGTILPMRNRDRLGFESYPSVGEFARLMPSRMPVPRESRLSRLARGITNLYREVLYLFLQRFIYRGQLALFGTITNPVGCAVAYRRRYIKDLFDYITPRLGDDLTNSEDIFIGFALLNEGYRNIQVSDVYARTCEPPVTRLPRQVYLWSSSFLQSCYYFDPLLRSPLWACRRWRLRSAGWRRRALTAPSAIVNAARALGAPLLLARGSSGGQASLDLVASRQLSAVAMLEAPAVIATSVATARGRGRIERRIVSEPYRQAFGRSRTLQFGRPVGWLLFSAAIEKVFFPTFLFLMLMVGNWEGLGVTVAVETAVGVAALAFAMKGHRLEYIIKALAVVPVRYCLIAWELVTLARFASDLWVTKNRKWRK